MPSLQPALQYPYVLFDLGSTLVYFDGDFEAVVADSFHTATRVLRAHGYNLDEDRFPVTHRQLVRHYYQKRNDDAVEYTAAFVLSEALRAHGLPEPEPDHLREALRAMYAVTQARYVTEADALPMLQALRGRGHRLGIVSNAADDDDVQTLVDNAGMRSYFDFVLSSAAVGVRKPSPVIFERALAFWGARPEQAVMVGDTVSADVAGANGLGIASVWITRRAAPENKADAERMPPRAVIETLAELPSLLEGWQVR